MKRSFILLTMALGQAAPAACAEICARDEMRCVGTEVQICSSEHDAWLAHDSCRPSTRWPATHCVSLEPTRAFCSLTEGTVPECTGHETACLDGTLVGCTSGFPTRTVGACTPGG